MPDFMYDLEELKNYLLTHREERAQHDAEIKKNASAEQVETEIDFEKQRYATGQWNREQTEYHIELAKLGHFLRQENEDFDSIPLSGLVDIYSGVEQSFYTVTTGYDAKKKEYSKLNQDKDNELNRSLGIGATLCLASLFGCAHYIVPIIPVEFSMLSLGEILGSVVGVLGVGVGGVVVSEYINFKNFQKNHEGMTTEEVRAPIAEELGTLHQNRLRCFITSNALTAMKYNDPTVFDRHPKTTHEAERILLESIDRRQALVLG